MLFRYACQQPFRRHNRIVPKLINVQYVTTAAAAKKNLRMYRILLRQCEDLYANVRSDNDGMVLFQEPVTAREYGDARMYSNDITGIDRSTAILSLYLKWIAAEQKQDDDNYFNDYDDDDDEIETIANYMQHIKMKEERRGPKNANHDEGNNDNNISPLRALFDANSVWASKQDLKHAIRLGMLQNDLGHGNESSPLLGTPIQVARTLNEQELLLEHSVVTNNLEMGVRVVATSQYIGGSFHPGEGAVSALGGQGFLGKQKYRFAYRMRVENLPSNDKTVQLLGRTWNIHEHNQHGHSLGDPVNVSAPTTGAVGHLPVLHPGEAFCYTSGCELETETGSMEGCFHMAVVDPATARRGMVGDQNIIPLQQDFKGIKFEMPVGPFPLVYPDTNT